MPSAVVLAVGVAVVLAGALALMLSRAFSPARALDDTAGGLRKLHDRPIPRIGGLAVAFALLGGFAVEALLAPRAAPWMLLAACAVPGFVWGLLVDFSQRDAVLPRLVLPALGAALGFIVLDARVAALDVPVLDSLLTVHALAFLFTLVAVTGVTHAVNVIDGLNGLAGVSSLLAAIGLALVAHTVHDSFVFGAACVLAACIIGFLAVNYPSGRIFLGDGGAYLIGFVLAELSVLLVQGNSEVSPWFPLVLLAFPIWETLFSMYRRNSRGRSSARADALHLHTLVYRRVVRWKGFGGAPADTIVRNSVASACLWPVPAACLVVSLAWWDDSIALQIAAAVFAAAYSFAYWAITRFKVPAALLVRRAPHASSVLRDAREVEGVGR